MRLRTRAARSDRCARDAARARPRCPRALVQPHPALLDRGIHRRHDPARRYVRFTPRRALRASRRRSVSHDDRAFAIERVSPIQTRSATYCIIGERVPRSSSPRRGRSAARPSRSDRACRRDRRFTPRARDVIDRRGRAHPRWLVRRRCRSGRGRPCAARYRRSGPASPIRAPACDCRCDNA